MEQLLTILKLCLLALLYLFFLRVLRAVWVEVNGPKQSQRAAAVPAGRVPVGPVAGAAPALAASEPKGRRARKATGTQLTVVEPAEQRGRVFPISDELTVGRAAGCGVTVDDTYASQLHARVFRRDGQLFVEDLGSTNGTLLNKAKVTGPATMSRGDRLQVGNTVLELSVTSLRVGSASHPGRVRTINEDSQLISGRIPLYAVADGMGGHQGGEVASAIAVRTLDENVQEPTLEALIGGVELANRNIRSKAAQDPSLRGMGTTLCAIVLLESDDGQEEIGWVNVGDSRIYLFRDDELIQLSDDHNLVAEMQRKGQITDDQAAVHPQRNIITRALGIDSRVLVDSSTVLPYTGDRFLLCSDGLSDELNPDQIAATMRRLTEPGDVADDLVRRANEHGGRDNVTCVVVDVVDDGDRAVAASAALAAEPNTSEWAPPPDDAPPSDEDREFAPRNADPFDDIDQARSRHITWRVVGFVFLFLAILAVAVGAVGWAAKRTYFVDFAGDQVVIYQGRPGGLLGFDPELEQQVGLTREDLTEAEVEDVESNPTFSSLGDAQAFTGNLENSAADRSTTTTTTTESPGSTTTSQLQTTTTSTP